MAKVKHIFLDLNWDDVNISVDSEPVDNEIEVIISVDDVKTAIYLDKSTAIKFAKTLRTEINKIES